MDCSNVAVAADAVAADAASSIEGVVTPVVTPVANNPPTIVAVAATADYSPIAVAAASSPAASAADDRPAADATAVSTTTAEARADECVCSAAVAVQAVTPVAIRAVTPAVIAEAVSADASLAFVAASLVTPAAIPNLPATPVAIPVVAADASLASVAALATTVAAIPNLLVTPDAIRVVAADVACSPGFEADVRLVAVAILAKIVPEPILVTPVHVQAFAADWLPAAANWARVAVADVTPVVIRVAETLVVAADAERLSLQQ